MTTSTSLRLRRVSLYGTLAFVVASAVGMTGFALHLTPPSADTAELSPLAASTAPAVSNAVEQLRKRLASEGWPVPPARALEQAMDGKRAMLSRVTTLAIKRDEEVLAAENILLFEHPDWLVLHTTAFSAEYTLDTSRIAAALQERLAATLGSGTVVEAQGIAPHDNDERLQRATLAVHPQEGFSVNWNVAADAVRQALEQGESSVIVSAVHEPATVVVTDASGATIELTLLATGQSNFAHSAWGRSVNIRKGLNERIDGTIIPQGVDFSFNDAIGPMTSSRGWKEALGIFGGVNLKPIVGGGICQVATTVYRAALLTGLPVDARKNHSMYVSYYKAYGVGLDATVFPGQQDLTFRNDTPGPLFLESWTDDNDDAFVRVYGIPDGRQVALDGPYYKATAPEGLQVSTKNGDRDMKGNEIAWRRTVTMSDGTERTETIVSTYNTLPKALVAEAVAAQDTMHAAAPAEGSLQ